MFVFALALQAATCGQKGPLNLPDQHGTPHAALTEMTLFVSAPFAPLTKSIGGRNDRR